MTKRTPLARRRRLTLAERMHLKIGSSGRLPPPFRSDGERRRCWERNREALLAECVGKRPDAWWSYDAPIPFPAEGCYEEAVLFEEGLLTEREREHLLRYWKMRFDDAWSSLFTYLTVTGGDRVWLKGEAARAAHFKWAGIPPRLVEQWTREREAAKPTA